MKQKNKYFPLIAVAILFVMAWGPCVVAAAENIEENHFLDAQEHIKNKDIGDIIDLGNITYSGSGAPINVNRDDVTIKGESSQSKATLDAKGLSRIATITGSNITFKYINFINGNGYKGLSGSVSGGGAVLIYGDNIQFIDCNFINNTAYNGGAIYINEHVKTEIFNSNFAENTASYKGAAIYNLGNLNIYFSDFSNNLAFSKLNITVPKFVNYTKTANILVKFIVGNGIVGNGIYNENSIADIKIDGITPLKNNNLANQIIWLLLNGKYYHEITNGDGEAKFEIDTKNLFVQHYKVSTIFFETNLYSKSNAYSSLLITNYRRSKVVYSTDVKYYKKPVKMKYAKIVHTRYKILNGKIRTDYYRIINGKYYYVDSVYRYEAVQKAVDSTYKWIRLTSNNYKKYRWHEQKLTTKYYKQQTKYTYFYLNEKLTNKVINPNHRYITTSSKKIRSDWTKYLKPTLDANVNNKLIIRTVNKLINNIPKNKRTDSNIGKAIWKWNQKYIKYYYPAYGGTRYGASKVMRYKRANCIDHAHLAVTMFRIAGLPARYQYKALDSGGAHAWAKVYINGKWRHADTVIKFGYMRGQTKWIYGKTLNNDNAYNFQLANYNVHKKLKFNGIWCSISQKVYLSDGTSYMKYSL